MSQDEVHVKVGSAFKAGHPQPVWVRSAGAAATSSSAEERRDARHDGVVDGGYPATVGREAALRLFHGHEKDVVVLVIEEEPIPRNHDDEGQGYTARDARESVARSACGLALV